MNTPQERTLSLIAVSDDAMLTDVLARMVDGGFNAAAEVLPRATLPEQLSDWQADLILLDVTNDVDPLDTIHRTANASQGRVVAIGDINDVSMYRAAVQAGAEDYLIMPLDEATLTEVISRARIPSARAPVVEEEPEGTSLHLVIGARGGVGATSFAVSTAWLAAETYERETALIDLDLHFGSCALALDLLPGSGLRDALQHPERIDSLFVGSAMINATDKLFVLGAEESLNHHVDPSPAAIATLYEAVASTFKTVIIDIPRHALHYASALIELADSITIVTDSSIAGLRDTVRLQEVLADGMKSRNIQIAVVERPKPQQQVTRKEMEQGLGGQVHVWIPHDAKSASAAATQGKSLPEVAGPRGLVTKALSTVARDYAGLSDERAKGKKLWRW
ncbi:hypothetical protein EOI86_20480 [Hwanghaeella grinnelliae]|uniref:Response regulatory domain-containing protein n=1 Tax=Hwanghaeella grinnelliae TaxID=2500179 RepID=A0A437QL10_9PROT|nr:hypothetical protein [Hwanghaeella grinnelliae]RVU35194.1 hypothetical protein EOI86_20480 [Hwanghaeella grinnelliae]